MQECTAEKLVRFLDRLKAADFDGDTVARYLKSNEMIDTDFAPYIFFREDCYARNLIVRRENYELLVLTWLPEQRTPIHDHAGSRCWMKLLTGSLTFKTYAPVKSAKDPLKAVGAPEVHSKGGSVYIDDGIGIHSIANASSKPAITIHVYSKPIESCKIYNEKKRAFEEMPLDYFTLPPDFSPSSLNLTE